MKQIDCRWCGKRFEVNVRHRAPVTCSAECHRNHRRVYMTTNSRERRQSEISASWARVCLRCGIPIPRPLEGSPAAAYVRKYCSKECAYIAANPWAEGRDASCATCGLVFRSTDYRDRFCSLRCRRHESNSRRRAKREGVRVEAFEFSEVIARDGGKCWICGKAVRKSTKRFDPLGPSLDHLIPISAGGAHTLTNVRLAHLRCNLKKGARVIPAQPVLI